MRNIILVTFDSLRFDSFDGADRCQNFGYLKKNGLNFTQAISAGSYTSSAFPGIHGSTYPSFLTTPRGIFLKGPTLAEALQANGYKTHALLADNGFISEYFKYNRGFDSFENGGYDLGAKITSNALIPKWNDLRKNRVFERVLEGGSMFYRYYRYLKGKSSARLIEEGLEALKKNKGGKNFLWLHFMDTHTPYFPPQKYLAEIQKKYKINRFRAWEISEGIVLKKERYGRTEKDIVREFYDASVRYGDELIGNLIRSLKSSDLKDDFLIVLSSDHGEEFLEHGGFLHKPTAVYEELIRVPLVFYFSDHQYCGVRIKEQVSAMDIAPSILKILNIPPPKKFLGQSFIDDKGSIDKKNLGRIIFSEGVPISFEKNSNQNPGACGLRYMNWKYIRSFAGRKEELYNLSSDPGEKLNLIFSNKENMREIKKFFRIKMNEHFKKSRFASVFLNSEINV